MADQDDRLHTVTPTSGCEICFGTLATNPGLCERCQAWNDAKHIFQCMNCTFYRRKYIPVNDVLRARACLVCGAIGSAIGEKMHLTPFSTSSSKPEWQVSIAWPFTLRQYDWWLPGSELVDFATGNGCEYAIKCIVYLQIHQDPEAFEREAAKPQRFRGLPSPTISVRIQLFYQRYTTNLTRVERWEDSPFIDIQLVKDWVSTCEHEHGEKCNGASSPTPSPARPTDFRVVDVRRFCISTLPESSRYVALSYTWKRSTDERPLQLEQANVDRLQADDALRSHPLPAVIVDAIRLCADLGERYLWIDRLCIVQDDPVSKHTQIVAMDNIYNMAYVTIVAAIQGPDVVGLPGVRDRPRQSLSYNCSRRFDLERRCTFADFISTVEASAWNTRGWTFQERLLSRRCLCITDYQVYFVCGQDTLAEEGDVGDSAIHPVHIKSPHLAAGVVVISLEDYFACVSNYTARSLSYKTDILNAFYGVGNVLSRLLGNTRMSFGLPERYFVQSLLWSQSCRFELRDGCSEIPSWSWAAWLGKVQFHSTTGSFHKWDTEIGTMVKYYIQDGTAQNSQLRALDTEDVWFGTAVDFSRFGERSSLPKIRGMKSLPGHSRSTRTWAKCPHNPWTALSKQVLDPESCALSEKYPGCLVFNTTVASLFLSPRTAPNAGSVRLPFGDEKNENVLVMLDLLDKHLNIIGYMGTDKRWLDREIDIKNPYEFIVLCAAIMPLAPRKYLVFSARNGLRNELHGLRAVEEITPWRLRVMLIERHGGVARRLGIGSVETNLWKQAEPTWQTIVLF
ncbi:hypothetical protein W97_08055 [Coniosporium apollinis CBS 100218]|uniref:Heterokaryon incompatibility domain-containing protein n=1 Tax=Coniosporium apollinis (strain CBS 100218) TaxID=1168221 RepID=R7Z3Q0_CONA1|nr:uncharacterized protein W97_08055 [Coniosporium apollinis CBS 100218]EON68797.1 hypothetical protein W97_08055 [Coniosporium apollinis CBS 100218]